MQNLNLPGQLLNFLKRTTFVVVDEADSVLIDDQQLFLSELLSKLRPDVQLLCFTATWHAGLSQKVSNAAGGANRSPLEIVVNGRELSACKSVQQRFLRKEKTEKRHQSQRPLNHEEEQERRESDILQAYWTSEETKDDALYKVIYWLVQDEPDTGNEKILVFVNSKTSVQHVVDMLTNEGFSVAGMTGEMTTRLREDLQQKFADPAEKHPRILVSTDLLGRGVDFVTCLHVLIYEFPLRITEYVHRVGRTGRAGKPGFALTFLEEDKHDIRFYDKIVKVLEASGQKVPAWMRREADHPKFGSKWHERLYQRQKVEGQRAYAEQETQDIRGLPVYTYGPESLRSGHEWGSVLKSLGLPCSPLFDENKNAMPKVF